MNSTLAQALSSPQGYLSKFASSNGFWADFGRGFDHSIAEEIRQSLATGRFARPIRILPDRILGMASGAFAKETDTVYLRESLVASGNLEQIGAVIIEEFGHAIDLKVNSVETPRDEGAIFQMLVRGIELSAAMLAELRMEDDWGVLAIDGRELAVEMAVFNGSPNNDNLGGIVNGIPNNSGDDIFLPLLGQDMVNGGDGIDTLIVDYSANTNAGATLGIKCSSYLVSSRSGVFYAYKGNNTTFDQVSYSDIEKFNITGTQYSDNLRGSNNNDTLVGGAGKDRLFGVSSLAGASINSNFAIVANDAAVGTASGSIIYSQTTGRLFYNADLATAGLGATGGQFATLAANLALTTNDFVIVN